MLCKVWRWGFSSRQWTWIRVALAACIAMSALAAWHAIPLGSTLDFIMLCFCTLAMLMCGICLGYLRAHRRNLERSVLCEAEELAIQAARRHLDGI